MKAPTSKSKKSPDLHYTDHVVSWTIQGLMYGYPPCCIGEFVICAVTNTCENRDARKFNGTGFIPCIGCNKRSETELLADIAKRRHKDHGKFNPVVKRRKAG